MEKLLQALPFGKHKEGGLTYTGIHLRQVSDETIIIDQTAYLQAIGETPAAQLQADCEGNLTSADRTYLSQKVGALLWATNNSRPDDEPRQSMSGPNSNGCSPREQGPAANKGKPL
jgi:hypothetical protein